MTPWYKTTIRPTNQAGEFGKVSPHFPRISNLEHFWILNWVFGYSNKERKHFHSKVKHVCHQILFLHHQRWPPNTKLYPRSSRSSALFGYVKIMKCPQEIFILTAFAWRKPRDIAKISSKKFLSTFGCKWFAYSFEIFWKLPLKIFWSIQSLS